MKITQKKSVLVRLDSPFPGKQKKQIEDAIRQTETHGWKFVRAEKIETRKRARNDGGSKNLYFSRKVEEEDYDDEDED